jgi:hypothetical protein
MTDTATPGSHHTPGGGSTRHLAGPQELVLSDQTDWRAVRRYLNHHRSVLAEQAVGLYPANLRIRRTTLIAPQSWLPSEPVDLADIAMTWVPDPAPPKVTGAEAETRLLRPLRVPGQQFDRYTSAVRYLDPPSLFENRPSYRLLSLAWAGRTGQCGSACLPISTSSTSARRSATRSPSSAVARAHSSRAGTCRSGR